MSTTSVIVESLTEETHIRNRENFLEIADINHQTIFRQRVVRSFTEQNFGPHFLLRNVTDRILSEFLEDLPLQTQSMPSTNRMGLRFTIDETIIFYYVEWKQSQKGEMTNSRKLNCSFAN